MAAKIATPQVIITEQPASGPIRYRYKCEGRSAGTIPGEFATDENKTYPSIKIINYQGTAKVIVSCVTKDPPYRPHPHSLVGREGCKNGICTIDMPSTALAISFTNLGVQCARRRDINEALEKRQNEVKIDPFNTGFNHRRDPASLDMNIIRLCFQVYIEDHEGNCTIPLQPVVSNPVYDIKALGNLVICRLSECISPVTGGKKDIYLLCKKVSKDDIKVRFFEGANKNPTWEGFPDIHPTQVHEQTAIWFKAPPYKTQDISDNVPVFIQLLRPSDGRTSDPYRFEYIPTEAEPGMLKRKRLKFGNDPRKHVLLELQNQLQGAAYYNIPPTPESFTNLDVMETLNCSVPESAPTNNPYVLHNEEKLLNFIPLDSYTLNYVQNIEATPTQYQNFNEGDSTRSSLYSPVYESISSPVSPEIAGASTHYRYFNLLESPFQNNEHNVMQTQPSEWITKETVKNAIRAKCKNLQNAHQPVNNILINTSQPKLENGAFLNNNLETFTILQDSRQDNFANYVPDLNLDNLNSLLDADYEQLENLLVTSEDPYNPLNIPMNAMTISEASCNLSSLMSVESSLIPATINSE